VLHVHRADRADALVSELAGVLAVAPDDPFARELVAVHSRGFERWLAQQLALRLGAGEDRRDGVCANVEFPFPGRVVSLAMEAAQVLPPAGPDGRPRDPWDPARLTWSVLAELEAHPGAWGTLSSHIAAGGATPSSRRYAAARHVADLFDRYGVHRPEMLRAWDEGQDLDAAGRPIEPALSWQPALWRALRSTLRDVPGPSERLAETVAWLRDGNGPVPGIPTRCSLFGLTALPASYVEVLWALSERHEVHLFLLHPSPGLWQRCATVLAGSQPGRPTRDADPTARLPQNPLLRTWGRDAREMQVLVHAAGGVDAPAAGVPDGPDDEQPSTLLARVQADVRADRAPLGAPGGGRPDERPLLDPADRSVQVHSCHGRTRQVEVLRDAVLHLLVEDETLEPRDIVVLCPDIEEFAPIVEAVFGVADVPVDPDGPEEDEADWSAPRPPGLRVRLADRSLRATNPLLEVTARLLELGDARMTASEVLDLAARTSVRSRFRFSDDDVEALGRWVPALGIRWGLDASHREEHGVTGVDSGTWEQGLQRLAVGLAVADDRLRLVHGVTPFDDVEGKEADLAGRLAELVARLRKVRADLAGPHDAAGWRDAIAGAVDLLTDPGDETWQRGALGELLDDLVAEAAGPDGSASPVRLTLPEVRALLLERLRGRPSRANHRTGDLTVCTLVPMRSVPHRVVCLLGMDDDAFPRRTAPDGDDLLEQDPRVGDRDPRMEDRQLLLDAVLAATERLVVTYTGHDERTNAAEPPAVPVGELLDVLDRTVRTPDGRPARDHVVTTHPLQPFDARNFRTGELHPQRPWSFDPDDLRGARVHAGGGTRPPALTRTVLPPIEPDVVALDDVVAGFEDPAKVFLTRRLGARVVSTGDGVDDLLSLRLDGLPGWHVGSALLDARDPDELERALRVAMARGGTPPGELGRAELDSIAEVAGRLVERRVEHVPEGPARVVDVDLPVLLPDRRELRLVGQVPDVRGTTIPLVTYSKVKAKSRLRAWLTLLAVAAAEPGPDWRAVSIGRYTGKRKDPSHVVVTTAPADPAAHLGWFVARSLDGLRTPLPFAPETSNAWARSWADTGDLVAARDAAANEWGNNPFNRFTERTGDAARILYGVESDVSVLLDAPDLDGGDDDVPDAGVPTRFARLATHVFRSLAQHEETS
jgi:exodeoxyribonuclease V gamma subunit